MAVQEAAELHTVEEDSLAEADTLVVVVEAAVRGIAAVGAVAGQAFHIQLVEQTGGLEERTVGRMLDAATVAREAVETAAVAADAVLAEAAPVAVPLHMKEQKDFLVVVAEVELESMPGQVAESQKVAVVPLDTVAVAVAA